MWEESDQGDTRADPRRLAHVAYRAGRRVVRNHEDALDVAQGALAALEMWRVSGRGMPCDPEAWVSKVAQNMSKNLIRSWQRERKLHEKIGLEAEAEVAPDFVVHSIGRILVELVLGELPPQQRRAVVHRYLEGRDRASVAELMGVSEETVKTHLKRAVERMRVLMDGEDGSDDSRGGGS